MKDLFDTNYQELMNKEAPLADRMRPKDFEEFIGQEEVVGEGKPLRKAIERDELQSLILWGPPGSGKTTLAYIIAKKTKAFFQPFSAVTSGVQELREHIKRAQSRRKLHKQKTILFVDEIHRFNKAQQDAFLPFVENGTIIIIGATTENPSFEIISPLLSRSMVIVLRALKDEEIAKILLRALKDKENGLGNQKIVFTKKGFEALVNYANGDARVGLNSLEFVVSNTPINSEGIIEIDEKILADALQKKALRYDKKGEEHYNTISAFIKSMRDSNPDAALYWLARMLEAGEDPRFIARRMLIFASEDIGNMEPMALLVANAVAQAVEHVGMPEAQINLAQGVTFLASAPKDNASYKGLFEAIKDVRDFGNLPVPLHLRNAVTNLMRDLGYGREYKYAHNYPQHQVEQEDLPPELKGRKYYRPREKNEDIDNIEEKDLKKGNKEE